MTEEITKVAWNLSAQLLYEIANLLSSANNNYISGHISKAFYSLQGVKMRFIHSLQAEERDTLDKYEQLISKLIRANHTLRNVNNTRAANFLDKAAKIYLIYNETIMDYLEKYGYLISEKEDASKMVS